MILLSPLLAVLASGSATAYGQGQGASRAGQPTRAAVQPQPQPVNDPVKMKWLLGKWAEQSAKLKTLDVHIERIDKDPKWKDEVHFEGRAVFKNPNLAYLDFKEVKLTRRRQGATGPGDQSPERQTGHHAHRDDRLRPDRGLAVPLQGPADLRLPAGQGRTAAGVDEGPLPFLFNMKAKEAEARYQMLFMGEDQKTYAVKIYPRLQEDKESFKAAFLYLDKEYLLPKRIALITPDGRSIRDFSLHDIKANKPVDDIIFKGGIPPRAAGRWSRRPRTGSRQQGNAAGRPGGAGLMPRR